MRLTRKLNVMWLLLILLGADASLAGNRISLDQAVESARRDSDGRVISAETREWEGRQIYDIRILDKQGRVKRMQIDGRSGQQLPRGRKRAPAGNRRR
ncbi:MAG: ribosome biogenesis GTPase RsgA [gamma proteobacterium endosymbiont of Lamellibrachia anaximandri]|nr:ribosome biogenesis GTPase RsgA [gamma proteobacterium endosymbiont of Lamellibrachia anaximandri]